MVMYEEGDLAEAIFRMQEAQDSQTFEAALRALQTDIKRLGLTDSFLEEVNRRAYYLPNEYSEKDTKARIREAGKRVAEYVKRFSSEEYEGKLPQILDRFDLFLETLTRRKPDQRAGIQMEQLEKLKIQNEYDVQHFLYAYLKPLYPLSRREVCEDTGYASVRADIILDEQHVIEVKCTRPSMSIKKLTEEIEADMVHYSASHIYFFLYDKSGILDNPQVFKRTYESKMTEKNIYITIHQPKYL